MWNACRQRFDRCGMPMPIIVAARTRSDIIAELNDELMHGQSVASATLSLIAILPRLTDCRLPGDSFPSDTDQKGSSVMQHQELSWPQIKALPRDTVVVLPVAAIEQHGPHLPVGVDSMIA